MSERGSFEALKTAILLCVRDHDHMAEKPVMAKSLEAVGIAAIQWVKGGMRDEPTDETPTDNDTP